MREAASRGFWVASRVPYGYRKLMVQDGAKKRPSLEPDAATSAIVERIFGMAEAGRGILAITRTLNDEGIANPTGRLWSKNGVHIILRNEVYTGSLVWGTRAKDGAPPVRVENAHPAIVSKRQFQRVNKLLGSRAPKKVLAAIWGQPRKQSIDWPRGYVRTYAVCFCTSLYSSFIPPENCRQPHRLVPVCRGVLLARLAGGKPDQRAV